MKKYRLIREYPGSPDLGWISNNNWKGYPEFWELVVEKDYEILEIKGKYGAISSYIEELDNDLKDKTIFKIKRLSDGEIFTIGDKVSNEYVNYTINKIDIVNDKCMVSALYDINNPNGSRLHYNLNNLKKFKQKLFTTEDSVDIFEGDNLYSIDNMLNIKKHLLFNARYDDNTLLNNRIFFNSDYKHFSTKEKAEEYILMNKPCLSLNEIFKDVEEMRKGLKTFENSQLAKRFKKLVKQKLNNNN